MSLDNGPISSGRPVIRNRFVDFATQFQPERGHRDLEGDLPLELLGNNEVAVDVGGVCQAPGEGLTGIFDHHFGGAAYPCASAAVLAHAGDIANWAAGKHCVFVVTHREPDFDALCSSYLVRSLANGSLDPEIESVALQLRWDSWFEPRVHLRRELAWALWLAAYAARLDQARVIPVEPERRLHSVLYAARFRGRDCEADGLAAFFDEARERIEKEERNPLFDAVFDESSGFAPELELLAREPEAYRRDLARARKSLVRVPVIEDFAAYHQALAGMPLLSSHPGDDELLVSGETLEGMAAGDDLRTFDAVWIEDPSSLLFKEWAREDYGSSSLGRGYTFTAVRQRDSGLEYFFALDPERSGGAHLYPLWAKLQRQEAEARRRLRKQTDPGQKVRRNFEERAKGFETWFRNDPWFDGANFRATIVVSPNEGTVVNEEALPELATGGMEGMTGIGLPMEVAQSLLEDSVFVRFDDLIGAGRSLEKAGGSFGRIRVWQYPIEEKFRSDHPCLNQPEQFERLEDAVYVEPRRNHYIFAEVRLDLPEQTRTEPGIGIGLNNRLFAEQVGRKIWPLLQQRGADEVPTDFVENHLLVTPGLVAVWSRQGVVLAGVTEEQEEAHAFREHMEEVWKVAHGLKLLGNVVGHPMAEISRENQDLVRSLLRRLSCLQVAASLPGGATLAKFLESVGFDRVLEPLGKVTEAVRQEEERSADRKLQRFISIFGTGLAMLGLPSFLVALMELSIRENGREWFLGGAFAVFVGGFVVYRLVGRRR